MPPDNAALHRCATGGKATCTTAPRDTTVPRGILATLVSGVIQPFGWPPASSGSPDIDSASRAGSAQTRSIFFANAVVTDETYHVSGENGMTGCRARASARGRHPSAFAEFSPCNSQRRQPINVQLVNCGASARHACPVHHTAFVTHDRAVGVSHCRRVRDDECGAHIGRSGWSGRAFDGVGDQRFASQCIERAGGSVEQQDRAVGEDGAGDGDAPMLLAGEAYAAPAELRCSKPFGRALANSVTRAASQASAYASVARFRAASARCFGDAAGENHRLLRETSAKVQYRSKRL